MTPDKCKERACPHPPTDNGYCKVHQWLAEGMAGPFATNSDTPRDRHEGIAVIDKSKVPEIPRPPVAISSQTEFDTFGSIMKDLLHKTIAGAVEPDQAQAACKVADVMLRALEMKIKFEASKKEA